MSVAETTRTELADSGVSASDTTHAGGRSKPRRKFGVLGMVLRVGTSVALIVWLLQMTSLSELSAAFSDVLRRWPYLALAALSPMIGFCIVTMRWKVLLGGLGAVTRFGHLFAALLVGGFFNNFFPSTIGGDIARSWWIQKLLKSSTLSLTIVAMDRFIGLMGFCAVGLIAVAFQPSIIGDLPQFWIVVGVIGGAIAGVAAIVRPETAALAKRLFSISVLHRFSDKARQVHQGIVAIHSARPRLFAAFILSMLLQANIITEFYILSLAIDVQIGLFAFAILIPIVTLVALLPISINGIGLREGTLASVGAAFGLGVGDAITLSWLYLMLTLPHTIAGGIIYARGRRDR